MHYKCRYNYQNHEVRLWKSLHNPPRSIGVRLLNPLNHKTGYCTPWTIQNHLNNPLGSFEGWFWWCGPYMDADMAVTYRMTCGSSISDKERANLLKVEGTNIWFQSVMLHFVDKFMHATYTSLSMSPCHLSKTTLQNLLGCYLDSFE